MVIRDGVIGSIADRLSHGAGLATHVRPLRMSKDARRAVYLVGRGGELLGWGPLRQPRLGQCETFWGSQFHPPSRLQRNTEQSGLHRKQINPT